MCKLIKQDIKSIISDAKDFSTYDEKLEFLKGKFEGQTCYILGCGPSLKDVDKNKLIEEIKEHTLFTIKQSLFGFKEYVDFHFFNDNNFVAYPNIESALYIANSGWNSESAARAYYWKSQQIDICTRVVGTIFKGIAQQAPMSKLQYEDSFDISQYTFEKTGLMRTWGAGIMYELVLFFAHHLGYSDIKIIGWDYSDPNIKESIVPEHFYNESSRLKTLNPCEPAYPEEMLDSINLAAHFDNYFKENKVNLKVHKSAKCFLPNQIERYVL